MRIEYSPDVEALYVLLGAGEVVETVVIGADTYADLDEIGNPIGIKELDAPEFFRFLARYRNEAGALGGADVIDLPGGLIELARHETLVAAT